MNADDPNATTSAVPPVPEQPFDTAPLPGESYLDGPYLVFTEAYHLRRGYCCNNGCRHCPFN